MANLAFHKDQAKRMVAAFRKRDIAALGSDHDLAVASIMGGLELAAFKTQIGAIKSQRAQDEADIDAAIDLDALKTKWIEIIGRETDRNNWVNSLGRGASVPKI